MARLGQLLGSRDNGLNFLRLLLATMVIVDHSPAGAVVPNLGGLSLGNLAVGGFFSISGFLIAQSRDRLPLREFLLRRALRILPGFWVSLAVVALVAAPLSTLLTGRSWEPVSALGFIWRNAGLWVFQQNVADTLEPGPFAWWNGPLWTLSYEFAAYVAAGVLLSLVAVRRRPVPPIIVLMIIVTLAHAAANGPGNITGSLIQNALTLGGYFVAGMTWWALREVTGVSWATVGLAAGVLALTLLTDTTSVLSPLPLAYLVLSVGALSPVRVGTRNDVSYGMYIYGWPVERLMGLTGWSFGGAAGYCLAAVALTLVPAWLSWRLIERPALRLRRRSGRAGVVDGRRVPSPETADR